ncbi:hypothetical protein SPRG_19543 [Saprolegnia parasitica CBS 223.65]|uniref:Uncharacterized protein n=1 Tax=Saprolegnia parasitica (strain CBS 223.65) TaxID=695850 RepID=A0A067CQ78_SAPPC|nr:hypothetical protein SPRG_19543 [Saprolegnia parasitica CBS 223.65]KDO31405.1 hypothetical protein SPRG_19543 [Saprolegnia parasitica CBS 223.65]|eukprot:XP_012198104.1 hypothetical protein SPRG_19543 [Saprolegnia parasitica CBS 223.65]
MAECNMNTHFCVKNINGTSGPRYAKSSSKTESSWLEMWRQATGSNRRTCCINGCAREDLVGAHVMITDRRSDNTWYLAPLCKGHNHCSNTNGMWIARNVTLIPVSN